MYLARVFIIPKPTVNDPQGHTILQSLRELEFESTCDVRVGKYIEVRIMEDEQSLVDAMVQSMCDKLLSNPVIEDYKYELERL